MRGEIHRPGWTGGPSLSGESQIFATTTEAKKTLTLIFSRSHAVNDSKQQVRITISQPWEEPFSVEHPARRVIKRELRNRGALPFKRLGKEANKVLNKALQEANATYGSRAEC